MIYQMTRRAGLARDIRISAEGLLNTSMKNVQQSVGANMFKLAHVLQLYNDTMHKIIVIEINSVFVSRGQQC